MDKKCKFMLILNMEGKIAPSSVYLVFKNQQSQQTYQTPEKQISTDDEVLEWNIEEFNYDLVYNGQFIAQVFKGEQLLGEQSDLSFNGQSQLFKEFTNQPNFKITIHMELEIETETKTETETKKQSQNQLQSNEQNNNQTQQQQQHSNNEIQTQNQDQNQNNNQDQDQDQNQVNNLQQQVEIQNPDYNHFETSKENQEKETHQMQNTLQDESIKENHNQTEYKLIISEIRAYFQKEIDIKRGIEYDTFATLKVGENQQKSEIAYNCGNQPEWQEQFIFLANQQRWLEIEFFDQKPKQKTRYNGKAQFLIDNFKSNKQSHVYKGIKGDILEYKGETKLVKGHIYFDLYSIPPNTFQEQKNKYKYKNKNHEDDENNQNYTQQDLLNSNDEYQQILENENAKIAKDFLKKRSGLEASKFLQYEKCTFGSRDTVYNPQKDTPAPNQYPLPSSIGKDPTPVTLKFRIPQQNYHADNPGPNHYQKISQNSNQAKKTQGWGTLGLGDRSQIKTTDSPGPANYSISSKFDTLSNNLSKSLFNNSINSNVNQSQIGNNNNSLQKSKIQKKSQKHLLEESNLNEKNITINDQQQDDEGQLEEQNQIQNQEQSLNQSQNQNESQNLIQNKENEKQNLDNQNQNKQNEEFNNSDQKLQSKQQSQNHISEKQESHKQIPAQ